MLSGIQKINFFRRLFCLPLIPFTYLTFQTVVFGLMPLFGFTFGKRPITAEGIPDTSALFIPASAFFVLLCASFTLLTVGIGLLYPEVEFTFGALRYERRVKARKVIAWIFGALVVPIVLGYFF